MYKIFDKRILNFLVILVLTYITFWWTFFVFHRPMDSKIIWLVFAIRSFSSFIFYKDYSLSWSKASVNTFFIKLLVYFVAFFVYLPILYNELEIYLLLSELFLHLFLINFFVYAYRYVIQRLEKDKILKTKTVFIYGAGKAGVKLREEFSRSEYKVLAFIDDNVELQRRSIDGIPIFKRSKFLKTHDADLKVDLLVIAMPSAGQNVIKDIYVELKDYFHNVRVLPKMEKILQDRPFSEQIKDISVEDLLARNPKDLDKKAISGFIKDKVVLVTGAGGSIGSEIAMQCAKYNAKKIILLDHSEFNLYAISEKLANYKTEKILLSVINRDDLFEVFEKLKPQIVIHAAAYKHVPMCEYNMKSAIDNNILGTINCIDAAIINEVEKFVLISTDKAVRPTNVMGTTKRICELYAQNVKSNKTDIVAVRFGNVLGSSGSVIPKFMEQIENGGPVTVTHKDITRYFMLIPEACELVLQSGALATGGEIFILDMGEPVKIVDLANKVISLSGRENIAIEFTGLRSGEKLYEELLINESDRKTKYESITIAIPTVYDIDVLNKDIEKLVNNDEILVNLKAIVPEFDHKPN